MISPSERPGEPCRTAQRHQYSRRSWGPGQPYPPSCSARKQPAQNGLSAAWIPLSNWLPLERRFGDRRRVATIPPITRRNSQCVALDVRYPPDCVSGRRCGSGRDGSAPGRSVERSRRAGSHIRCRPLEVCELTCCTRHCGRLPSMSALTVAAFSTSPPRTARAMQRSCAVFFGLVASSCSGRRFGLQGCAMTSARTSLGHVLRLADRANAAGGDSQRHPHA